MTMKNDIDEFLASKCIAVAGVSRNAAKFSNKVYCKLKESGFQVYPVNPNAEQVAGDQCFHDIGSLPDGVQSLLITAKPDVAVQILREAMEQKIDRVWVFTDPGKFPSLETQIEQAREVGVKVISGLCPLLFLEPLGFPHNIHRFFMRLAGKYPG